MNQSLNAPLNAIHESLNILQHPLSPEHPLHGKRCIKHHRVRTRRRSATIPARPRVRSSNERDTRTQDTSEPFEPACVRRNRRSQHGLRESGSRRARSAGSVLRHVFRRQTLKRCKAHVPCQASVERFLAHRYYTHTREGVSYTKDVSRCVFSAFPSGDLSGSRALPRTRARALAAIAHVHGRREIFANR